MASGDSPRDSVLTAVGRNTAEAVASLQDSGLRGWDTAAGSPCLHRSWELGLHLHLSGKAQRTAGISHGAALTSACIYVTKRRARQKVGLCLLRAPQLE